MIKKFFAIAAVAAMLIACGEPEDNKPAGGENNGGTNTENPGGNGDEGGNTEEPVFLSKVQIDGDYADWEALEESDYVVATLPEGEVLYPALKTFKMHADDLFLYIFLEFNPQGIFNDVTGEWSGVRNLDIFIDEDNDPDTGRYYAWAECASYMLQGAFYGKTTAFNPAVSLYTGVDGQGDWSWENVGVVGGVTAVLPTVVSEETAYFECALLRPMFPFGDAETIGVGVIVETEGWSSIGQLPQFAVASAPASVEENVEGDDATEGEGETETEGDTETEGGETEGDTETEEGETEEEVDPAARPSLLYINLPVVE